MSKYSKKDVVSTVPPDKSGSPSKSLGKGGGGMHDNPGIKGITTFTGLKRPSVSRSDVLQNKYTLPIKGGLKVKVMETKKSFRRSAGTAPGKHKLPGKDPVR